MSDRHSSSSSSIADEQLIERCLKSDLAAFDLLVARHQNRIYNLCYWMLGNREDATDAAQDTFIRAFRSLKRFRGESSFATWVHRIAVNGCIDLRHRRRQAPLPYSDLVSATENGEENTDNIERLASQDTHSEHHPDQMTLRHEKQAAIREALAKLPDHYRLALILFDIEGRSYDEIAHILELPLGTVKSRISRARLLLRNELQSVRELFEG